MNKKCDKCKKNPVTVSYKEVVNGKTLELNLCSNCANRILSKKEEFLNSFFNLDPFREFDDMFESMLGSFGFKAKLIPKTDLSSTAQKLQSKKPSTTKPQIAITTNPREDKLKELKSQIDALKQEEGIAVMLQDYLKAAEIKKKREKIQKEAEKIINQSI